MPKSFDVFKENMRLALSEEECARREAILADPDYQPREVQWRDDPDPFGRDWDWLEGAEEATRGGADASKISPAPAPSTRPPSIEPSPVVPFTGPGIRPSRRLWLPLGAAAIAASILVGVFIGKLVSQGGGWAPPSGDLEIILASATPKLGVVRGNERPLLVELGAERPGFATVIALSPVRRQRVFPEPGEAQLRVGPSRPETYGPLPPGSTLLLVLTTETPATESIRDALLGKDFRASDLSNLRDSLRGLLSASGYRWVGLGVTPLDQATEIAK